MTFEEWAKKEYYNIGNFLCHMEDAGCFDEESVWELMEKSFNAGKLIGVNKETTNDV
jgi:hypothetical protein